MRKVITTTIELSCSLTDFENVVEEKMISTIATELGVPESRIRVVENTTVANDRVYVTFDVAVEDDDSNALQSRLSTYVDDSTSSGFESELNTATPSVTVTASVVNQPTVVNANPGSSSDDGTPPGQEALLIFGIVAVILLAVCCCCCFFIVCLIFLMFCGAVLLPFCGISLCCGISFRRHRDGGSSKHDEFDRELRVIQLNESWRPSKFQDSDFFHGF
jgi:hypothetical protein